MLDLKVNSELYQTVGWMKNEKNKMTLSPDLCSEGSWQYAKDGIHVDDTNLRVEKIGKNL